MFERMRFPEGLIVLTVVLIYLVVVAWPAARICRRVGFSPWLGVLAIAPIVNVLLLWYVAFARWPGSTAPSGA